MAIATTPNQKRDWVLPEERDLPPEKRTTFEIRGAPVALRSHFGVLLGMSNGVENVSKEEIARLYLLALRCCLVGWRNFRDDQGRDVPFVSENLDVIGVTVRGAASLDSLDRLDSVTSAQLGQECLNGLVLTKGDVLG